MEEILTSGFAQLDLPLPDGAAERFQAYYELLNERNKVMNLTAITGEAETARLHFLDCAALLKAADFAGKQVIDVGTGAGFPGVPLKIAEPSIRLTLLDSQAKRIRFLDEVIAVLGLTDTETVLSRAEEAPARFREHFDIACARAVTRLDALAELCLPLVRVGGVFVAMKGPAAEEELREAETAIRVLGGSVRELASCPVPGTDVTHRAIVIEKTARTPDMYPRRWAKIQKTPIR